jgi:Domain of unknown function (DU1801)
MQSKAATVDEYLAQLPADRREAIATIRDVIRQNLDTDYEEGMQYGMIGYYVPHRIWPAGYHCDPKQPLPFAGLASQKNHLAVYLMCVYGNRDHESWFRTAWAKTGKKLDMGKSCIRFKKLEDAALDVIGEAIRRVPAAIYIAAYQALLGPKGKPKSNYEAVKKKLAAKRATAARKKPAKPAKTKRK